MSDAPSIIATIPKNTLEDVLVSLSEYRGHHLVDVRVFADFSGADGEKKATKKGVSLKVEKLPELVEALRRAEVEARHRGLLPVVAS